MAQFNILAFGGGGVSVRSDIEPLIALKKLLGAELMSHFHMAVGTSAGAIPLAGITPLVNKQTNEIGSGLYTIEEAAEQFDEGAPRIFDPKLKSPLLLPRYSNSGLRSVFEDVYGDTMISDYSRLIITASNKRHRGYPFHFDSDKARGAYHEPGKAYRDPKAHEFFAKQAVAATCSAPYYFNSLIIENALGEKFKVADGGVADNNPLETAVTKARKRYGKDLDIFIYSLGGSPTRLPQEEYVESPAKKWIDKNIGVYSDHIKNATETIFDLIDLFPHSSHGRSNIIDNHFKHVPNVTVKRVNFNLHALGQELGIKVTDYLDDASPENMKALRDCGRLWVNKHPDELEQAAEVLYRPRMSEDELAALQFKTIGAAPLPIQQI